MWRIVRFIFYLIPQLLLGEYSFAAHIVGGELSYKCLGSNNYLVMLKLYRDCYSTGAQYDNPTTITVFNSKGEFVDIIDIDFPGSNVIPNKTYNLCLTAPPNICVEEAVFQKTVYLPALAGGYTLVYQRCCRNNSILNIWNPGSTGASYVASIPDPSLAACNSSPVFTKFPPTVICVSQPITFDHAATDSDGDSLAYSFFNPFAGGNTTNVYPVPAIPPPFQLVNFNGYTFTNPIGGTIPLSLDSKTGFLSGTPNTIGQFVVGICVKEFRKGALLSTHYRDFQFNVVLCKEPTADFSPSTTATPTNPTNLNFPACRNVPVKFNNSSTGGSFYHWDFGIPGNADTSGQFSPSFSFPNVGTYTVTLKVNPGLSCETIATTIVTIYPYPQVATGNNGPLCEGDPIQFSSNLVLGGVYSWKGPNGFTSAAQNPVIPISVTAHSGNYSLVVTEKGCSSPGSVTRMEINPIPVITAGSNSPACIGRTINLSAANFAGAAYSWTGANGFSSTLQNPVITNITSKDAGVYQVTATAKGCASTPSGTIVTVSPIPDAPVLSNDAPLCSGATLHLTAADVTGGLFRWTGPNNFSSNLQNPVISNVQFADSGTYQATVTVSGCTSAESATDAVIRFAPTSDFTLTPSVICPDQDATVQYTGNGNISASFQWEYGNGIGERDGMGPYTAHFKNPGLETITLTTQVDKCPPISFSRVLLVDSLPAVRFKVSDFGCAPLPVQFFNETRNGNTFFWGLGDGDSSVTANPLHVYYPGVYSIKLIATNPNGCIDSIIKHRLIEVVPNPIARYSSYPPLTRAYELSEASYIFTNESKFSDYYTWHFGDGDSSKEISPNHKYVDSGNYKVTLIAYDNIGCADTLVSDVITIVPNINYYIPNAFTPNGDGINDDFKVYGRSLDAVHLSVFDRLGEKIFESTDMRNGWNGKFKDKPLSTGVYVYYAVIETLTGKTITKKGDVMLLK